MGILEIKNEMKLALLDLERIYYRKIVIMSMRLKICTKTRPKALDTCLNGEVYSSVNGVIRKICKIHKNTPRSFLFHYKVQDIKSERL